MVSVATLVAALSVTLAAAVPTNGPIDGPKPKNIGIALFRGWQPMDVFGPIEALWGLGTMRPVNLYLIDEDGGNATVKGVMPMASGANVSATVFVDFTFENAPTLDVLIVPGGVGTRAPAPLLDPVINYVKDTYPSLQYIISVCTGASILARAGLLDGKRATTNKRSWAFVTQFGNRVRWQPRARYVRDRNVWTTSGISAGVDGMLGWIEYVWGSEIATNVTHIMEWNRVGANDDEFGKLYGLW